MKVAGKVFEPLSESSETTATHIGTRLREIRKLAGLTQAQVAERLKIGQSAVARLEGRKDLHVSTLRDYLGAMGATLRIDAHFDSTTVMVGNLRETDFHFNQNKENQLSLPIFDDDRKSAYRDIVFSIKPEYSRKIIAGEKTVELRRRFPISVLSGTAALIYETSPTRALSGIAEIGDVYRWTPDEIWRKFAEKACVPRHEFDIYFAGIDTGYAIELRYARPLRRSLQLAELRERFSFEPPQSFLYATPEMREALNYERSKIPN